MRMRYGMAAAAALGLATGAIVAADAPAYFASIAAGKARMRTGPGREFPVTWLYQRADLPVRVIRTYKGWKKVEDPDGTQGWIQGNLVSETRTALIRGDMVELRDAPRAAGRVQWRAAPGVVGRISKCRAGWCWFDVRGQAGYVEATRLWGVGVDETLN